MARLDMVDLETGHKVGFEGMPMNIILVKDATTRAFEQAGYYKPAVPGQAAFDAYSVTKDGQVVSFQYATARPNNDEPGRLNDVLFELGKKSDGGSGAVRDNERMWHHVLVVPDLEIMKFADEVKAVKLRDSGGTDSGSHIRQYVLSLKMERPT
jgi:hypothetical protein